MQSSYYIHGPLGDENIFAVLYVSLCYGPYNCYKTTVFITFIFAVFLQNLLYTYSLAKCQYIKLSVYSCSTPAKMQPLT